MNSTLRRPNADAPQESTEFPPVASPDAIQAMPATADTPDAGTGENDAFTPDTKEKADWVLGRIADARGRAARIREHADTMAKQAEAEATFLEWKFGAALQDLARRELAGGKRKSLTLYHGVLGFRTKPAGVSIGDSKAALEWARQNLPEAVTETIDRATITKTLLETGEAVDFAAFTQAEEVFFIK